jgi:AGZA family xanthine/uracil permease-like MFS transporter
MMESVREIEWTSPQEGLPAFLTLMTMPLTFSITHGIGAGFITYVAWKAFTGRAREVKPFLWVVAALFCVVFAMPLIERMIPPQH